MENQNHIFDELSLIFSQQRLDGYLNHAKCNNSKDEALIAYSWNIELSQALYPALQVLEIALRNSLHQVITTFYNTEFWLDLPFLHNNEKEDVQHAKEKLIREKKPLEAGRLVAELSFGFWTALFDIRYEHGQVLWPKLLKPTFPFLPKGQRTRQFLSRELNQIRFLRNRIFHYEPIWHWRDLLNQHTSAVNLIGGLSKSAQEYLNIFDQFKNVYSNRREQINDNINQYFNNK